MIDNVMEKRIELELRGREAAEVRELNLDNCRASAGVVAGLSDDFSNLEAISMINVGLNSLKGFPALPNLKRLEISDNRLTGGLENLTSCPALMYLNLSGNKIADCDALGPLKELKQLKTLDLFNNDVTMKDDYRQQVFKIVPHLKYLDGFDQDDKEAEDSEDVGVDEEDDLDNEEEGDESDDDGDEVGLEYLQDSRALHDEDETEDFDGEGNGEVDDDDDLEDEESGAEANDTSNQGDAKPTRKRKHSDGDTADGPAAQDDEDSQD